eukprot:CAMPEP_0194554230 /NCGR_PEP_ID=MMETSP0253-20130528/97629_1 /TAXON_ID=2966 /ORGANISM="Noctiluca scintillans" /LENGTH=350 /DNA_ID=CAMNT_0039401717 /DNA_START=40 /DNA_END=1093 /DNA_ORIENTATION=-
MSLQGGPASTAILMNEARSYGVNDPIKAPFHTHADWLPLKRRRDVKVDWMMASLAVLVPCALFSVMIAASSFALFQMIIFVVSVVIICFIAYLAFLKMKAGDDATWFSFLFVSCVVAVALAGVLGNLNYVERVRPYQEVLRMNSYTDMNPTGLKGNALMDAGRISFVPEATVDASRTMGFINYDTYCVAPITMPKGTSNGTQLDQRTRQDLWAVGVNCCGGGLSAINGTQLDQRTRQDLWAVGVNCCGGGLSAEFNCGDVHKPEAHSALRLMHGGQLGFYRLAVQQAALSFNLEVVHPSFFHWVKDPNEMLATFKDDSESNLLSGIGAHFFFQISLVILLTVVIAVFFPK